MQPLLLSLIMSLYHYVNVPIAEMREEPNQKSEIVSQAIFSESVNIIEENEGWTKIETCVDGYKGWVKNNAICHRKIPYFSDNADQLAQVNRCAAHIYDVQDTVFGPLLTLPFESKLQVIDSNKDLNSRWIKVRLLDGKEGYIQRGDVTLNPQQLSLDEIGDFAFFFLDLPYTWGGRSSFGYDCSGFTQMLYRQMGIFLPRDSKDQYKWNGFKEISFDELEYGDLVFFGIGETKIRHVGMYLEDDLFIHTSVRENKPYVRISSLSDPEWMGDGTAYYTFRGARKLINREQYLKQEILSDK